MSKRPGAIVSTRTPRLGEVAGRRQRESDDAALRRRVGDLADLAVEGGDRGGVDADAALAALVGLVLDHRRGGEPQHVEGADQVHLDHVGEDLEVVRALLGDRPLRPADPGAADRDPQLAVVACRGDRGLDLLGLEHVRLDEARRRSPSSAASASPFSALRSAITTRAPSACRRRAVASPSPEAPPTTSALVPSIASARTIAARSRSPAHWVRWTDRADRPGQSQRADRRPPRGGARAHPAAGRAARPTSSSTRSTRRSSARSPGTSATSPTSRSSGWCSGSAGREPMRGELGRFYDAIENPRKIRNELPILRGDELRAYMDGVRERTLDVLDGDRARGSGRPDARRRLHLRDAARPRAPAQRDDAPAAADGRRLRAGARRRLGRGRAGRRGPGDGRGRRRARTRSAPRRRGLRLRQRAPPPRGRAGRLRDRPHPGHQRRLRRVRRRHRRPSRRCTGSATATAAGSGRRSGAASRSTRAQPVVHVELASGRRLRPLGGQAAADRARVGGGGGRRRPRARQPRPCSASAAHPPAPTPTRRRTPARCRCSATSGSGRRRTSPPTPASAPSRTPSTPRSSSATTYKVLRGGAWATRRDVIRTSFRNWDLPERSQIFSGIRCVRDG